MLPKLHFLAYQDLLTDIEELYSYTNKTNLELTHLFSRFQQVQKNFNDRVMTLNPDELEQQFLNQWQSLQTEIHRTLRLLGTDLMMLRSSRHNQTFNTRLITVKQRLEKLISYCQHLLS